MHGRELQGRGSQAASLVGGKDRRRCRRRGNGLWEQQRLLLGEDRWIGDRWQRLQHLWNGWHGERTKRLCSLQGLQPITCRLQLLELCLGRRLVLLHLVVHLRRHLCHLLLHVLLHLRCLLEELLLHRCLLLSELLLLQLLLRPLAPV